MRTNAYVNIGAFAVCALLVCSGYAEQPNSPYQLPKQLSSEFRLRDDPAFRLPGKTLEPPAIVESTESQAAATLADKPYAEAIEIAARDAGLDPALVHAVIYVESRHRQDAVSPKGALGLMQVLPDTAARYGIRNVRRSPQANLKAGTLYLKDLIRLFDDRLELALAAYNAGEGAVQRYDFRIPPYAETRQYVRDVLSKYSEWRTPDVLPPPAPVTSPSPAYIEYLAGTRLAEPYASSE